MKMTEAIIIKDVKSPERLLDETALFLHRSPTICGSSQAPHAGPSPGSQIRYWPARKS